MEQRSKWKCKTILYFKCMKGRTRTPLSGVDILQYQQLLWSYWSRHKAVMFQRLNQAHLDFPLTAHAPPILWHCAKALWHQNKRMTLSGKDPLNLDYFSLFLVIFNSWKQQWRGRRMLLLSFLASPGNILEKKYSTTSFFLTISHTQSFFIAS